jgi:hypothetical protein
VPKISRHKARPRIGAFLYKSLNDHGRSNGKEITVPFPILKNLVLGMGGGMPGGMGGMPGGMGGMPEGMADMMGGMGGGAPPPPSGGGAKPPSATDDLD